MAISLAKPTLPPTMISQPHWLLWRLVDKDNAPKPAKVPYSPHTMGACNSTELESLTTYETALAAWEHAPKFFQGLGFSLQGGIVCVDLDNCLMDSGGLMPWAQDILDQLPPSFTEVSQSRCGLHWFGTGTINGTRNKFTLADGNTVEIYQSKRFIAVTGTRFEDAPLELAEAGEQLNQLYTQLCEKQPRSPVTQVPKAPTLPVDLDDTQLIQKMFNSSGDKAIEALWHGDTSAYNDDESSADLALLSHLAWWTNGDSHRMERLFGQSMLAAREKWRRDDYRQRTMAKALEGFAGGYTGEGNKPNSVVLQPWPEPRVLPRQLIPVDPFAIELLPYRVRGFVEDEAHRMQAPIDFLGVSTMVVLAAIIGRQVTIRPKKHDDWAVVPNLWGMVVGRPSTLKTPSIAAVMKGLKRLEAKEMNDYQKAKGDYDAMADVVKIRMDASKKKLKTQFGKKSGVDMEAAAQQLREDSELPPEPVCKRYLTNDSTIEKVGELLSKNPQGMMVFRDELAGFLRRLDKDGHEEDRTFYLESWNGDGNFKTDRIGRGTIVIPALCLSIFGGIQPSVVSKWLYGMMTQIGQDDGLIQRFQLMVWPDEPTEYKDVDIPPNLTARQEYYALLDFLATLQPDSIGAQRDSDEGVPYLRFADDAQPIFSQWMTDWRNNLKREGHIEPLENHYGKYPSLVASLALICHLANGDTGPVTHTALLQALSWSEYLQSHATRIYTAAMHSHVDVAHKVLKKLERGELHNPFTVRDLQRYHTRGVPAEQLHDALDELEDCGYIRRETVKTSGRPKDQFHIHPHLLRKGA